MKRFKDSHKKTDNSEWDAYKQGVEPLKDREPAIIPAYKMPQRKQIQTPQNEEPMPIVHRGSGGRPTKPQQSLDLHGCTEANVYFVVENFVQHCIARNIRCVLIITGKGNPSLIGGFCLNEEVPRFLKSDKMKSFVVSITHAPQHLGGSGAFVVGLRARNKIMRMRT